MGTEETCGRREETGRMKGGGGGEEDEKLSPSFTTLSTIAIQAGQSQLVVSVLRSGSLVHLQLVQVHPGLCEIGWNQEQNHQLIQEQQQLIHKLQKHGSEALSLVKSSRQTQERRDEGMMELKEEEEEMELKEEEEELELKEAMGASLSEGWSLLLHLLHRRQEVLTMASDFHQRALEEQEQQITSLLQEKEEVKRLLRLRETEVYALTQRTEELETDRDQVRLALERTEAAVIGYKERSHQQEQSSRAGPNSGEGVGDRLVVLQRLVAELELEQKRLNKKNSHLENTKEKLKRERHTLRDTLRQVEDERSRLQLIVSSRSQESADTTEEERLRSRVLQLEEQVSQLHLSLAVDQQQRAEFIQQSSRNSECLLSLRHDLGDSLAIVTHSPIPSVLESETQRLDRSLREEELRMSLSQS